MGIKQLLQRILAGILILALIMPQGPVCAQGAASVPAPGIRGAFAPPLLKGVKVLCHEPFCFDFILEKGDGMPTAAEARVDAVRLIKYFLAALTVPETDLWVNLSPYERDRIIPDGFGQTGMGRDLLGLDYLLKKTMAMLLHPDGEVGRRFWAELYARAHERYGTTDVPLDTFNKVWITTDSAEIYERSKDEGAPSQAAVAFVTQARLKVLLETDYVAMSRQRDMAEPSAPAKDVAMSRQRDMAEPSAPAKDGEGQFLAKEVLRDIVIPVLEKEVNEGRDFSQLRQMYTSLVLATWYKKKLADALVSRVYADQNKVSGIAHNEPGVQQKIWESYAAMFREGVYNLIRDEADPATGEVFPRKYFSGGAVLRGAYRTTDDMPLPDAAEDYTRVTVDLAQEGGGRATTLDEVLGPSVGQRTKERYFSRLKLPGDVGQFLSAGNELVRDNNTKEFVQRMLDIIGSVGPDIGGVITGFMREEIGGKFPLAALLDPERLTALYPGDSDSRDLLKLAVEENDPQYISSELAALFKKGRLTGDAIKAAARTALFLRCLYDFPQERVPLRYLVDLKTSGILGLFRSAVHRPVKNAKKTVSKGGRTVSAQVRSIRAAIQDNNGPDLVRLINEIPCPVAKKTGVLFRVKRMLASFGYPLVDSEAGAAADNTPPASESIPLNVFIHIQLVAIQDVLSDTVADKELVLKQVFRILETVKTALPDNPRIYQELVDSVRAETGLASVQLRYLYQLATRHKDNEEALFTAVTQAGTAVLLGLDGTDIAILKAFQFLKKNKTNPTMERVIHYLQETEPGIDTTTLEKPVALQKFFTGTIDLGLQEEYVIYAREAQALRDFPLETFIGRGTGSDLDGLAAAMMQATGADKESVMAFLQKKDVVAARKERRSSVHGYPVDVVKSLRYIDKNILATKVGDIRYTIGRILSGAVDANQPIPLVLRGTLGHSLSLYIMVRGVVEEHHLKNKDLRDADIKKLFQKLEDEGLLSRLYKRPTFTLGAESPDEFLPFIKEIFGDALMRDKVFLYFQQAMRDRKVLIVALGPAAHFKKANDTDRMLPVFNQYLNDISREKNVASVPLDAAQTKDDLGGIDLDPSAMKLSIHTDAAQGCGPGCSADAGVRLTLTPAQVNSLRHDLQGLRPVIVNMMPHAPLRSFLEL